MGEKDDVAAKKGNPRFKEACKTLVDDGGRTAKAAASGLEYLHGMSLELEGKMTEVSKRADAIEKSVETLRSGAAETTAAITTQISELKLKASNASETAGQAKTAVAGLEGTVTAIQEADRGRDGKLGELATGWENVSRLVEALTGRINDAVERVEAAVAKVAGLEQATEQAARFVEVCGEELEQGVLNMQASAALRTGDFTKVLTGFDPMEIRTQFTRIAADDESDVKDAARSVDVESSPIAQAFAKAVTTWVMQHADAGKEVFREVCVEAIGAIGNPNAFVAALDEFIASGGQIGDVAQKTKDRAKAMAQEDA
jgi:hypothetical protein